MPSQYTYLLLDLATFFFPFILSFDKKVAFFRKWWRLFPAILISGIIFIIWDHFFTVADFTFQAADQSWTGIWNFNPKYLTGLYLFHLPIEEILFFFVVPYACVFIYEVLIAYIPNDPLKRVAPMLNWFFFIGSLAVAILSLDKGYTATTFFSLAGLVGMQIILNSKFMGRFYLMWLVHLIPFYVINGFLTALPVVVYNNSENLGVRVLTVPIEDGFYSFTLLLLNITIYEYLRRYKYKVRSEA